MKFSFFKSIRTHLILLVLLSILPALGIILYSGFERQLNDKREAEKASARVLHDLAEDHENAVQSTRALLATLSRTPEVQNQNGPGCGKILADLLKQNPLYANIVAARADGMVYASAVPSPAFSVRHRKFFQDAVKSRDFSVGEYVKGIVVQRPVLHLAYPVIDAKDRLTGVLAVALDLARYKNIFLGTHLPEGSVFAITDHKHIRLFRYPYPEKYMGDADLPDMIATISAGGKEGIFTAPGVDGIRRLYAYEKIYLKGSPSPYLYMRVGIPEAKVLAGVRKTFFINITLLCLAVLVALILAWLIGNMVVTRRLTRLVDASLELARGNLKARSGLRHSESELGQLAAAFDEMAQALEDEEKERELAEQNLKLSEEKYRDIFENAIEGIYRTSPEGRFLTANPAACTILGYDSSQELVDTVTDIRSQIYADPADRDEALRLMNEQGFIRNFETRFRRKDGNVLWVSLTARPVYDEKGNLLHIEGTSQDISDRKQAEDALRESDERYRVLVETSNEGIWVMDGDHVTTYVNQAMADMLGHTPSEMTGKKVEDFFFPEDMEFHRDRMTARHSGKDEIYERRFRKKDGSVLWTLVSAKALRNDQGGFAGSFAMFIDITEAKSSQDALRLSEERFRALTTATSDVVYHMSADWREMLYLDDQGFIPGTEKSSAGWLSKYIHPDDRDRVTAVIKEAIRSKRVFEFEHRVIRADGSHGWVFSRAVPLLDDRGEIIEWFGAASDITGRKQAEEDIKNSLHEKEILLKEIHHRVKNNLMVVSSILNLQSETIRDRKARDLIEDCRKRVQAMSLVHNRLYRSSDLAHINFREYTGDLLADIARSYGDRAGNIALVTDVGDITFDIDTAMPLGLIMNELVSNAMKHGFSGERKGTITVSLHENREHFLFAVKDDGIGFPRDMDFTGTESLGMQLVVTLVSQLEGSIELVRDNGTEFRITFRPEQI